MQGEISIEIARISKRVRLVTTNPFPEAFSTVPVAEQRAVLTFASV
jgi:hypothetical protein